MMRVKKVLLLIIPVIALVLEMLPIGVVLNFANPEGEPFRQTFSYFDLTPFGYANFGPLLTAVLTCVLVVLAFGLWLKENSKIQNALKVVSGISILTSLMPLMFGVNYFTVAGVCISILLMGEFIIMVWNRKEGRI